MSFCKTSSIFREYLIVFRSNSLACLSVNPNSEASCSVCCLTSFSSSSLVRSCVILWALKATVLAINMVSIISIRFIIIYFKFLNNIMLSIWTIKKMLLNFSKTIGYLLLVFVLKP